MDVLYNQPMRRTILLATTIVALAGRSASTDTSSRDAIALIGHWNFDKGNARDSSGNGLHGTASAAVAFKEGCAIFDGNGRIDIPIAATEIRRGYRTIDIEIRAQLDRPETYYNSLFSHPLFSVSVNALGSAKGRPCFAFSGPVSDLAPEKGGDPRWGKAARLDAATTGDFYYWGWIGRGSVIIPAATWFTVRIVYDGRSVLQFLDGKLVATHAVRNRGARIARDPIGAEEKAVIGRYYADIGSPTDLSGKLDYIRIRGTR